jgi:CxxC motif-containing protein
VKMNEFKQILGEMKQEGMEFFIKIDELMFANNDIETSVRVAALAKYIVYVVRYSDIPKEKFLKYMETVYDQWKIKNESVN